MCSHDYATVVIMFYSFCFNKVPSKTFRIAYGDSWFDLAEKQKLLRSRKQFSFVSEEWFLVDYFCRRLIDKFPRTSYFCRTFRVPEVFKSDRLLQVVLFLTDSVFRVLFAYFDESMASIGGYEPYRSWNTVGLTPI